MTKNKAYFYLTLVFFFWGTMFAVQKVLLAQGFPPLMIASARYIIAWPSLIWLTRHLPHPKIEKGDRKYFFWAGACGYFTSVFLGLVAVEYVGASLASLLASLSPVFVSTIAVFVLKEPVTRVKVLCLVLAAGGAIIVAGGVEVGRGFGVVIALSAQVFWGLSTAFVKKLSDRYDAMIITRYGLTYALLFNGPAFVISFWQMGPVNFSWSSIPLFLYVGIACTTVTLTLWNKSLSVLDASVCSLFAPLQPIFATTLGVFLLDESVGISFAVGAVLILSNVVINAMTSSGKIKDKIWFSHKKELASGEETTV